MFDGADSTTSGSTEENGYHFIGASNRNCTVCGEGVVPFCVSDPNAQDVDAELGLGDAGRIPNSFEALPLYDLDAPASKEGILDALARLHPLMAGALLCLCAPGGDVGQGFTFEFIEDPAAVFAATDARIQALRDEKSYYVNMLQTREALAEAAGGEIYISDFQYETSGLEPDQSIGALRIRLRALTEQIEGYENLRGREGRLWGVLWEPRKIYASSWINDDIDDMLPDGFVNRAATNRQAANWLARHLEVALGEGEFFWSFVLRIGGGALLMALGVAEIAIGAGAIASGGGSVAGGALLVTGWNAFEAGARMWATRDSALHRTTLDSLFHGLGTVTLGEDRAYLADRGWMLAQILIGFGASGSIVTNGRRVPADAPNVANARPRDVEISTWKADLAELSARNSVSVTYVPSQLGVVVEGSAGRFLLAGSDSEIRVLLRLQNRGPRNVRELVEQAPRQNYRPPVNDRHILHGEMNANGKPVGGHWEGSPNVRVDQVLSPPDANGIFRARTSIMDGSGNWVQRPNPATMFPASWSETRVLSEVNGALDNATFSPGGAWRGTSPSGIPMGGYMDTRPGIAPVNTAYPIYTP